SYRVDFIDKNYAGSVLLGLFEHIAHTRGAHTHEHLDEIGSGNAEERHFGLAGNCPRQQRLARTGIADHQHTARTAAAQLLKLARIAQEFDQFSDLLLGFFTARDVGKSHVVVALVHHARAALTK